MRWLVTLLVLAWPGVARAETPIVAVFEIEDTRAQGLPKSTLGNMRDYLANELARGGVFEVVPSGNVQAALREKKAESYDACYDSACQIEIGKELAASKSLATKIILAGKQCLLLSTLYDLRKSTAENSAKTRAKCTQGALFTALDEIARQLRGGKLRRTVQAKDRDIGETVAPESTTASVDEDIEEEATDWQPAAGGKEVIVEFKSRPTGALVRLDGRTLCRTKGSGCRKLVGMGTHTLTMEKEGYVRRREKVRIDDADTISWSLEKNVGWLTVKSEPSGLDVYINGEPAGKTPLTKKEMVVGAYQVTVKSAAYLDKTARVVVKRSDYESIELEPEHRYGYLIVKSEPSGLAVTVNGRSIGRTPIRNHALKPGRYQVLVRDRRYFEKGREINLSRGSHKTVDVTMEPKFAYLNVSSEPSGLRVKLDGKIIGSTPVREHELAPGDHEVLIADRCVFSKGKRFSLSRGVHKSIDITPKPRYGAIRVIPEDEQGNALEADVFVDGEALGEAPGTFKVEVCAKRVSVHAEDYQPWRQALSLEEHETETVTATLEPEPVMTTPKPARVMTTPKPARVAYDSSPVARRDDVVEGFILRLLIPAGVRIEDIRSPGFGLTLWRGTRHFEDSNVSWSWDVLALEGYSSSSDPASGGAYGTLMGFGLGVGDSDETGRFGIMSHLLGVGASTIGTKTQFTFAKTELYYSIWHFHVGVQMPLVWVSGSGLYAETPPIQAVLSFASVLRRDKRK